MTRQRQTATNRNRISSNRQLATTAATAQQLLPRAHQKPTASGVVCAGLPFLPSCELWSFVSFPFLSFPFLSFDLIRLKQNRWDGETKVSTAPHTHTPRGLLVRGGKSA